MRSSTYSLALAVVLLGLVLAPTAGAQTLRDSSARAAIERHMQRNVIDVSDGQLATHRRIGGCARVSRRAQRCYGEYAITVGDDRTASVFCGTIYTATLRGRSRRARTSQEAFSCSDRPRAPFTMWFPLTS